MLLILLRMSALFLHYFREVRFLAIWDCATLPATCHLAHFLTLSFLLFGSSKEAVIHPSIWSAVCQCSVLCKLTDCHWVPSSITTISLIYLFICNQLYFTSTILENKTKSSITGDFDFQWKHSFSSITVYVF